MSIRSWFVLVTLVAAVMLSCSGETPLAPTTDVRVDEQSSPGVTQVASSTRAAKQIKVTICHVPPGNPDNAHEITVAEASWPAHMPHGDTIGACESDEGGEPVPVECSGICSDLEDFCCDARIDCNLSFDDLENTICEAAPEDALFDFGSS